MDCLEFRRPLAAEPLSREPSLQAHRDECAACAAAWERAQQAERELRDALAVPLPGGLAERILLAQATGERQQHVRRRRFALALAASLLLAVAGGGLLWRQYDAHTLPALAVAHMPDEIHSLDLIQPVDTQTVLADFSARGVTLKGPLPSDITYVHKCIVGTYEGVHLVTRVGGESVAVLYLPHQRIGRGSDFKRDGWNGREVPLDHGTLVILTDQGSRRPFKAIEQDWRVAIDGLGGPRVSQL
jgi:hypothetical protein